MTMSSFKGLNRVGPSLMRRDEAGSPAPLKMALLIVDPIRGMMELRRGTGQILPNVAALADAARERGIPVFYVTHVMRDGRDSEILAELRPGKGDIKVDKRDYSAFRGTRLEEMLKMKGVTTIVIAGIYSDLCVRYSSEDAIRLGFKVIVPLDCIKSYQVEESEATVKLRALEGLIPTDSASLIEADFDVSRLA